MSNAFHDRPYIKLIRRIIDEGVYKDNRTGTRTLSVFGHQLRFNLRKGMPILTVKKVAWKTACAEMVGFLRGYSSAADFRRLGVSVWDSDANENAAWLHNPNRKGADDLGRIYGVQARGWKSHNVTVRYSGRDPLGSVQVQEKFTDQFALVLAKIANGVDDRRLIVSHWNPGELDRMALPPCHALYQFYLSSAPGGGHYLSAQVYIRSSDVGLGLPFNIAQYAYLVHLVASLFPGNLHVGDLVVTTGDTHIYENHLPAMEELVRARPRMSPTYRQEPCGIASGNRDTYEVSRLLRFVEAAPLDRLVGTLENYRPRAAVPLVMAQERDDAPGD